MRASVYCNNMNTQNVILEEYKKKKIPSLKLQCILHFRALLWLVMARDDIDEYEGFQWLTWKSNSFPTFMLQFLPFSLIVANYQWRMSKDSPFRGNADDAAVIYRTARMIGGTNV